MPRTKYSLSCYSLGAQATRWIRGRHKMKVIAVEGSPEEISRLQALTGFLQASGSESNPPNGSDGAVPEALRQFVMQRSGATYRPFIERFVEDALALEGVVASLGRSTKYQDGV